MNPNPHPAIDPTAVLGRFALIGRCLGWERYGNGHINDTFLVRYDQAGTAVRWILQRLNARVFPQPQAVMANIAAVTTHLASQNVGETADSRAHLSMVPGRDGHSWVVDDAGAYWRCYPFIEGSRTIERVSSPTHAHAAAVSFGRFLAALASYDGPRLVEVIPGFHDTPARVERLRAAATADSAGRVAEAKGDIAFAFDHAAFAGRLLAAARSGAVPERITHNDTKINNVLFAAEGDTGLCVIDLDTVMPGLSLFDFGDLVRTATATAAEDEADLSLVDSAPDLYAALAEGWLHGIGAVLTPAERELMPTAGAVITYECGVRFLTDHLDGDRYFKVKFPGHNLVRARNQFAMATAILRRHNLK